MVYGENLDSDVSDGDDHVLLTIRCRFQVTRSAFPQTLTSIFPASPREFPLQLVSLISRRVGDVAVRPISRVKETVERKQFNSPITVVLSARQPQLLAVQRRCPSTDVYAFSASGCPVARQPIVGMHDEIFHFEIFENFMEILKYFKTPSLKYFMKFVIFIIK